MPQLISRLPSGAGGSTQPSLDTEDPPLEGRQAPARREVVGDQPGGPRSRWPGSGAIATLPGRTWASKAQQGNLTDHLLRNHLIRLGVPGRPLGLPPQQDGKRAGYEVGLAEALPRHLHHRVRVPVVAECVKHRLRLASPLPQYRGSAAGRSRWRTRPPAPVRAGHLAPWPAPAAGGRAGM